MFEQKMEEKLFEKNTLCIFGVIDDETSKKICKQLLSLQFKFKQECVLNPTIVIFINSPGGMVTSGLAIYDAIKALNCKVVTVCMGQAASMAATILSLGTKGYRFCLDNSEIMIHQPLGGTSGQTSDIVLHCEHMVKTKNKLNEILSQNTGQPIEQIRFDTERDCFMSPEQAIKYGIVDKIINSFTEVYDELFI